MWIKLAFLKAWLNSEWFLQCTGKTLTIPGDTSHALKLGNPSLIHFLAWVAFSLQDPSLVWPCIWNLLMLKSIHSLAWICQAFNIGWWVKNLLFLIFVRCAHEFICIGLKRNVENILFVCLFLQELLSRIFAGFRSHSHNLVPSLI